MSSEDVVVFTCEEFTPEEQAEAESFQRECGILANNMVMHTGQATEFPVIHTAHVKRPVQPKLRDAKKKRKAKLAQASRLHNRRL